MNPADAIQAPEATGPTPGPTDSQRRRLSARDLAIVRDICALGLVTAQQVQRLRFVGDGTSALTQARRSRRALARLHDRGILARLARRVGGVRAGSAGHIYRATPTGRRLLGLAGPQGGKPRGYDDPTAQRTAHTLAATEIAVRLVEAYRAGYAELLVWQPEPVSWRTWTGPAGDPHTIRPDAFAILAAGPWEHLAFVEVDLGTEHVGTVARKIDAYRSYHAAGIEQDRHGAWPRVVILAPDPARRAQLARTLNVDHDPLVAVADLADPLAALTTTAETATPAPAQAETPAAASAALSRPAPLHPATAPAHPASAHHRLRPPSRRRSRSRWTHPRPDCGRRP
jgi:protein involved in plasmid replication-relaxation